MSKIQNENSKKNKSKSKPTDDTMYIREKLDFIERKINTIMKNIDSQHAYKYNEESQSLEPKTLLEVWDTRDQQLEENNEQQY